MYFFLQSLPVHKDNVLNSVFVEVVERCHDGRVDAFHDIRLEEKATLVRGGAGTRVLDVQEQVDLNLLGHLVPNSGENDINCGCQRSMV